MLKIGGKMFLSKLEIEGYKNFGTKTEIEFHKGLNVLVGENGVGKTAIIDAIRLLFPDEDSRKPVSDTDFYQPFTTIKADSAKSFEIKGEFAEMSKKEIVAFLPWTDIHGTATLTLQVGDKATNKGWYRPLLWGGNSRSSMFEKELFDAIDCIYLPPLRDAEAKLREGKASRLAKLLKNMNKVPLKEAKDNRELHCLEKEVRNFNAKLVQNGIGRIEEANLKIKTSLKDAIGSVFGQNTSIQFSETNFNRIVEGLRLFFFPSVEEVTTDVFRSLESNSLGYNNLLYIATVLAELSLTEENSLFRILLIEEPEAHLHPQLQVRLLKYLEKTAENNNVQVIVTTHSPVLAASASIQSLIHLSKLKTGSGYNYTAVPLRLCGFLKGKNGEKGVSENFVSRWLDITKSTLLFAKGVILVEGIAEAMLLPEFAKIVLAKYNSDKKDKLPESLEDAGVSVINMNGIYFKHFMPIFCNLEGNNGKKVPVRCAGITDNDPPAESKPTLSNLIKGENPALKLIEEINQSYNVRLYSSPLKTFEYDLGMENGNLNIMILVAKSLLDTDGEIKKVYENDQAVDWSKEKDSTKKAEASYHLLTHIDKGVFSQSLADHCIKNKVQLEIPCYIKKAIIWACGGDPDAA